MDEVEKTKEEALKMLRSIKTLDDLKAHKDEILDLIEVIFKTGVKALYEFFGSIFSLSEEEKVEELSKFQDESFFFGEDIEKEFARIDSLPGAIEYMEMFHEDLDARIDPYVEKYRTKMEEIMEKFAGAMVDGMMAGLGEIFGGPDGGEDEDNEIEPEPWDSREDLEHLDRIYDFIVLEHLKENKDYIIEDMEKTLVSDRELLKNMTDNQWPKEQMQETLDKAVRHRTLFISEMERQFRRVGKIPGASEYAEEAVEELKKRTGPISEEIRKFEEEFNK